MRTEATWANTARPTCLRSRGSGRSSTSGRATWATRSSTPRSAGSARESATTGTSPRAGGRSAWPAPGSCCSPRPPAEACPPIFGGRGRPAAAVANEYFIGAINRVGVEPLGDNDFYGQTYFADPRGQLVGDAAADDKDEVLVRDLDLDLLTEVRDLWQFYRDRRPDAYQSLVQP